MFYYKRKKNHEELKKDGNMNGLWPLKVTGSLEVTGHCDLLYDPKGHGDLCGRFDLVYDPLSSLGH